MQSARGSRNEGVTELIRDLETLRLGGPDPLAALTAGLSELWGAQAVAYRPTLAEARWDLEFLQSAGKIPHDRVKDGFREYLASAPVRWTVYNPLRPEPNQRNAVWGDRELLPTPEAVEKVHVIGHFYRRMGVFGHSQLRTLVCDGPVMLAWLGGFRAEPFSAKERSDLRRLIAPARRRLAVERRLADHGNTSGGLAAALDEIPSPALLVSENARVQHANAAALRLFEREGLGLLARVRTALAAPGSDPSLSVTPIAGPGFPRHFLVVLRGEAANVSLRVALVRERWQLTRRQADVLQLLARGEANKSVAEKLGLSEVTIEFHVTALLRKARVDNRAALVARFWTET